MIEFSISSEENEEVSIISITGEVDIFTSPRLKEEFIKLFKQDQFRIVVNMLETRYFDASGLGVLAGALKHCYKMGGSIAVVYAVPHIIRVFNITGMDKVFKIFETQKEAISFLNNLDQSK